MSENANQKGAPQKIETPSEAYGSGSASGFLPENAKNPKEDSDWLGGPQNGNETASGSDFTKHRFDETRSGSDWLGGPQNGNETPSEKKAPKGSLGEQQNSARNPQTGE